MHCFQSWEQGFRTGILESRHQCEQNVGKENVVELSLRIFDNWNILIIEDTQKFLINTRFMEIDPTKHECIKNIELYT